MNLQPIEILLVEDNEDDILIIREALTESKLSNVLNVVKDGEEALSFVRREQQYKDVEMPGLILLDINMPKKNGFEVLKEMKEIPDLKHIPVVMLTMSDRDVDITRSFAEGAYSFIPKPEDFETLKDIVKQFELYWTLVSRIPSSQI